MKRIISLLLGLVMCLSLCACGKSQAAVACEELIAQIGEVTLDSEEAIVDAENAFSALSGNEKKQISESAQILLDAREKYDELLKAKEEAELQARLDDVIALIEAIGEVSVDSESAIAAAEAAYAALADEEKEMIAESGAQLSAARESFDAIVAEAHAAEVINMIDAIGTVSLDSEAAIRAAREQYDALTAEEQALVTNYNALESAENELETLKEAEKDRILSECTAKFEIEEDRVERLTWYMHNNMPDYIDTRSYIVPYIGVQNDNVWICIRYNYTADDWVFWESLKIVVDGEDYSKYVGAFGTVRDNEWGNVWEYYDEPLNYNQSLDSDELVMLKKIAESQETIIRFQGDDYHYDLIVTQEDKNIIKDVLALYSALLG